ncbi:MAG: hypothetical protein C3F02_01165 [Parcubacteria group bacterium]|nr:MAG: hypothetical protein C3F02_01165 [Parcubacteria group bacterium]
MRKRINSLSIYFLSLAMALWNTGLWSVNFNISNIAKAEEQGDLQVEIMPAPVCGNNIVESGEQCDDGNTANNDGCSATCQNEVASPWCSALQGIIEKAMGPNPPGNTVPDIDDNNVVDGSDLAAMSAWKAASNDAFCYQQFDNQGYQFNCENYLLIDWCNGLKQGIADSLGSTSTTYKYWPTYDLNHDGFIDASDLSYVAMYLGQGQAAQQECFDRFPFRLDCTPDTGSITVCKEDSQENPLEGWTMILGNPNNLVLNAGFEAPVVDTNDNWNIFNSLSSGLEWLVRWITNNPENPPLANLELHKNGISGGNWLSHEGSQYAELDTDWDGPSGSINGEPASVGIYQDINTIPGQSYHLSFWHSPRPGQGIDDNKLQVSWGGGVITSPTIDADGSALVNNNWIKHEFDLAATTTVTRLEFADLGTPNSLGDFLDDISLTAAGQQTGADGCTTFTDLPYGEYQVHEVIQPNWTQIIPDDPDYFTVNLNEKNPSETVTFVNRDDLNLCGNQRVDDGEECDYGSEPIACETAEGYSGTRTCHMPVVGVMSRVLEELPYCRWNPCYSADYCGDDEVNGPEECDDGNTESGDGCSSTCINENICVPNTVYTVDADFDKGTMSNVTYDIVHDQLQLSNDTQPFNFIWVAVSSKGTIVKINTDTGVIMGEYRSTPENFGSGDPSRTTVDKDGSVWVGNRAGVYNGYGSIIHIGLLENNQCEDRNGNGIIDTSTGQNDIRGWTDNSGTREVATAQDECIVHYLRLGDNTDARHISIDANNDVWAAGNNNKIFYKIKGGKYDVPLSGTILNNYGSIYPYGGYGGLIDSNNVIWSARNMMRWDTTQPLSTAQVYGHDSYGLCIDSQGNVYNTQLQSSLVHKFDPSGTEIGLFNHGTYWAQGCVIDKNDDLWVAGSLYGNTIDHLKNDGTFLGSVTVGDGPTGVAVDANNKIWATNYYSGTVSRIDPTLGAFGEVDFTSVNLGGNPYNYSDMTGSTLKGAANSGNWTVVHDGGVTGKPWNDVSWNSSVPEGAVLTVTVATSDDGVTFGAPLSISSGQDLSSLTARYLQINVSFERAPSGASPILYDLTIDRYCTEEPPVCGNEKVEGDEQCDVYGAVSCTTEAGYSGSRTCKMPPAERLFSFVQVQYCVWNPCETNEYCGDGIVNGREECDAGPNGSATCSPSCVSITPPPTHPSGGGGGGGVQISGPNNIQAGPQCTSATVSWTTTGASVSWIVYGTTSGVYTFEYKDGVAKTGHSVTLPNLQAGQTYYYRVKMMGTGDSVITSEEKTFVTKTDCGPVPQVLGVKINDNSQCTWAWRLDGRHEPDKDAVSNITYPEGTLLRGCINPNVYRIENGRGRWIRSWQELHDKYRGQRIYNIPDAILDLFIK